MTEKLKVKDEVCISEYFDQMTDGKSDDEQKVYKAAVMAFINDISYNGIPAINTRPRFTRELWWNIYACFALNDANIEDAHVSSAIEICMTREGQEYYP